jgi:hypothetical protein
LLFNNVNREFDRYCVLVEEDKIAADRVRVRNFLIELLCEINKDDSAVAKDVADESPALSIWVDVWPTGLEILADRGIYHHLYESDDEDDEQKHEECSHLSDSDSDSDE